jgi:hypothetical protein
MYIEVYRLGHKKKNKNQFRYLHEGIDCTGDGEVEKPNEEME